MHFSLQIINMNKQVHKQKKMMKWNLFSRLVLEHCIKLILPPIHTTRLKQMYLALIYFQIHPFQRQLIWISGSNRSCSQVNNGQSTKHSLGAHTLDKWMVLLNNYDKRISSRNTMLQKMFWNINLKEINYQSYRMIGSVSCLQFQINNYLTVSHQAGI